MPTPDNLAAGSFNQVDPQWYNKLTQEKGYTPVSGLDRVMAKPSGSGHYVFGNKDKYIHNGNEVGWKLHLNVPTTDITDPNNVAILKFLAANPDKFYTAKLGGGGTVEGGDAMTIYIGNRKDTEILTSMLDKEVMQNRIKLGAGVASSDMPIGKTGTLMARFDGDGAGFTKYGGHGIPMHESDGPRRNILQIKFQRGEIPEELYLQKLKELYRNGDKAAVRQFGEYYSGEAVNQSGRPSFASWLDDPAQLRPAQPVRSSATDPVGEGKDTAAVGESESSKAAKIADDPGAKTTTKAQNLMRESMKLNTVNNPKEAFASQLHQALENAGQKPSVRPERFSECLESKGLNFNDPENPLLKQAAELVKQDRLARGTTPPGEGQLNANRKLANSFVENTQSGKQIPVSEPVEGAKGVKGVKASTARPEVAGTVTSNQDGTHYRLDSSKIKGKGYEFSLKPPTQEAVDRYLKFKAAEIANHPDAPQLIENYRQLATSKSVTGGWKIHIPVESIVTDNVSLMHNGQTLPTTPRDPVARALCKFCMEQGIHSFKVGGGGEVISGTGMTIYVGSQEEVQTIARKLATYQVDGKPIEIPKAPVELQTRDLPIKVNVNGKTVEVYARWDVSGTDKAGATLYEGAGIEGVNPSKEGNRLLSSQKMHLNQDVKKGMITPEQASQKLADLRLNCAKRGHEGWQLLFEEQYSGHQGTDVAAAKKADFAAKLYQEPSTTTPNPQAVKADPKVLIEEIHKALAETTRAQDAANEAGAAKRPNHLELFEQSIKLEENYNRLRTNFEKETGLKMRIAGNGKGLVVDGVDAAGKPVELTTREILANPEKLGSLKPAPKGVPVIAETTPPVDPVKAAKPTAKALADPTPRTPAPRVPVPVEQPVTPRVAPLEPAGGTPPAGAKPSGFRGLANAEVVGGAMGVAFGGIQLFNGVKHGDVVDGALGVTNLGAGGLTVLANAAPGTLKHIGLAKYSAEGVGKVAGGVMLGAAVVSIGYEAYKEQGTGKDDKLAYQVARGASGAAAFGAGMGAGMAASHIPVVGWVAGPVTGIAVGMGTAMLGNKLIEDSKAEKIAAKAKAEGNDGQKTGELQEAVGKLSRTGSKTGITNEDIYPDGKMGRLALANFADKDGKFGAPELKALHEKAEAALKIAKLTGNESYAQLGASLQALENMASKRLGQLASLQGQDPSINTREIANQIVVASGAARSGSMMASNAERAGRGAMATVDPSSPQILGGQQAAVAQAQTVPQTGAGASTSR